MIGALLAARFIAKKPWTISALFWAILLVLGMVMTTVLPARPILLLIIGFILFLAVAFYYLKVKPIFLGIIMYVASIVFNLIIAAILGFFGVVIPW